MNIDQLRSRLVAHLELMTRAIPRSDGMAEVFAQNAADARALLAALDVVEAAMDETFSNTALNELATEIQAFKKAVDG